MHTLQLTDAEADLLLAALNLVVPIGGGSPEFCLYRKACTAIGRAAHEGLTASLAKTVLDEAVEAEIVVRL